jgi:hypothetical protein
MLEPPVTWKWSLTAFDPFQMDLYDLQMKDTTLQMVQQYMTTNQCLPHLSKADCNYFETMVQQL